MTIKSELFEDITNQLDFVYNEDPFVKLSRILGDKYIDYRKKWVESAKGKLVQDYPIHLNIALNDTCNLRCKSCIQSIPVEKRTFKAAEGKISLDKFKELLEDGVKHGLCSVDLSINNEPLLVPDFADYVKAAKDAGVIDIMMISNANLLTEEKSRALIEAGITWISFSIDAITEETYNKLRIGGNYDRVVNNILRFLEIKKELNSPTPITKVNFVHSKVNDHELESFKKFWENKVDLIAVQKLINSHMGHEDSENFDEDLKVEITDAVNTSFCVSTYQRLVIRNNGDILPCCSFFSNNLVVGNIYKDSIYELWNSKKFDKLRSLINCDDFSKKPKECRICISGRDS